MGARQIKDDSNLPTGVWNRGASNKVDVAVASAQSAAVGASTRLVLLTTSTACYFKIAANPTATATGSELLIPEESKIVPITGGHKVAFIRVSADGVATVTELA